MWLDLKPFYLFNLFPKNLPSTFCMCVYVHIGKYMCLCGIYKLMYIITRKKINF